MKPTDLSRLARAVAPVIREYTESALAPVFDKLDQIERRLNDLPAPAPGKDADEHAIVARVREGLISHVTEIVRLAVSAMPAAKDGVGVSGVMRDRDDNIVVTMTDGSLHKIGPVVDRREIMQSLCGEVSDRIEALKEDVERASKRIPDIDDKLAEITKAVEAIKARPHLQRDEVRAMIDQTLPSVLDESAVEAVVYRCVDGRVATAIDQAPKARDGRDGKDADMDAINKMIADGFAALPKAQDGRDGVDGLGLASMVIDRSGNLIATMTNGETKDIGPVVGRAGADADMASIERTITECVKALPRPKDGKDGLGFDDMTEELAEDGRTIVRRFMRGDHVREFRHAVAAVLDRGTFKVGKSYQAGDLVTWGGSTWIAQRDTGTKPDTDDSWRLAVKKGRDARGAKP